MTEKLMDFTPQQTTVTINPIPVLSLSGPHTAYGSYDLTQTISGYDPTTYTHSRARPLRLIP